MGMIREFLWSIAKFALNVLDLAYSFLYDLATLQIFDFPVVKQWYYSLSAIIVFFVVIRIIALYFSDLVKEDTPMQIKLTPVELLVRISVISLVIFVTPDIFGYVSDVGISFIENINLITTSSSLDSFEPSTVIIENMIQGGSTNIESIVINKKHAGEYIVSTTEIFWAIALGAGGAVAMLLIALQVTQRFLGLAFKLVISPFPISSLVNHQSQSFRQWTTLCVSDVISNAGQFLFLLLILAINSSAVLEQLLPNPIVKAIFFVGSCLAVLSAPSGIAQLFGNDFGAASSLQSLNTMKMLGGTVKGGIGVAVAGAGYAAGTMMTAGAGVMSAASVANESIQGAGGIKGAMTGGGFDLMRSVLSNGNGISKSNQQQGINSNVQTPTSGFEGHGSHRLQEEASKYSPIASGSIAIQIPNKKNSSGSTSTSSGKFGTSNSGLNKSNSVNPSIPSASSSSKNSNPGFKTEGLNTQPSSGVATQQQSGGSAAEGITSVSSSKSNTPISYDTPSPIQNAGQGKSQNMSSNMNQSTSPGTNQSTTQRRGQRRSNPNHIKNMASFASHKLVDVSRNRWEQSMPAKAMDKTVSTFSGISNSYKNFVKANEIDNKKRGDRV